MTIFSGSTHEIRSVEPPIGRFRLLTSALALFLSLPVLISCNSQSTHLAYVTAGNGGIFGYRIRNGNGVITNVFTSPFLPGDAAFGIVVHPSNQFVYVANQRDGTISQLNIDFTSGALTQKLPTTPAGISPGPMVLDSTGAFLYVADQALNQILVFSVAANGDLSQVSSAQVAATPTSLTLASSGFLFVPVASLSDIYVFTVNSGSLTQVCSSAGPVCLPFHVSDGVSSVAVDPSGKFLYVPNPSTSTVSGFVIQAGGSLTPVPGVVFSTCASSTTTSCPSSVPTAAAVDPTGHFLYVANTGTTTISEFTIDTNTGELTPFTTPTQNVGTGPSFIAFDPDDKFVYVANSRSLTQLLINSNGTLDSTGNTIQVGSTPRAAAITK
jgi:6-phosphogluconolactonase (cycloisomerase 2 family)